ncbi:hypothetical protein NC653_021535 [Populus alba x Populus x berolinensis]|uniref:Uncharacterized protein n=1 Tax=Populus alba x Populus x berolinensis TaxID=444605 RepID=A0AAD6QDW4_9ROSI|nr:hypothetical protein NC653_021535 [Populus alba x Populus x berolinensis]
MGIENEACVKEEMGLDSEKQLFPKTDEPSITMKEETKERRSLGGHNDEPGRKDANAKTKVVDERKVNRVSVEDGDFLKRMNDWSATYGMGNCVIPLAEFTLEELDSRKHLLNLQSDLDEAAAILPMVSRRKGDGTSKHSNVSFKGIQKHVLYWISESRKELMLRKQQKLFIHAGLPIGYVTCSFPYARSMQMTL